jgi:hypothetical protein
MIPMNPLLAIAVNGVLAKHGLEVRGMSGDPATGEVIIQVQLTNAKAAFDFALGNTSDANSDDDDDDDDSKTE